MCRLPRTTQPFFGRLNDAWCAQFPDVVELPHWGDLLNQNITIFDLDFDAILAAMYAATDSAEGDCYLYVPPAPGIEAAALGASESAAPGTGESAAPGTRECAAPGAGKSALSGTAPTEALHTFTLDSGASRSFFRDSTTLTPLSRPVAVSLPDPSGGPDLAHSSFVLPCPAAPSSLLSGLHLPSFSTNLVSGADLLDVWVDQFTPGGQRVTHCTCSRTGRHLATFTHQLGSSLYTLTTQSPPVTESGQVAASGQAIPAASKSSMASRTLVSGLPRSLPPLPLGPAPTCVPCVEGQQRSAPHSSEFPQTEAPFQTLHMDVWGLARVRGQGHERYFLLVVDDYSRYTTLFPLRCKEGIRQTFTLPASPQQNGIAERRLGMVMDVPRTSMIHAAAPHFLWPPCRACEVAVDSGATSGAEPTGAGPGGAEHGVAESEGAKSGGAEPERVEPGGAESGGAEPGGPLSSQRLREWYARRCSRAAGATGHAAGGASRAGAAGGATGAGAPGAAGPGGTGVGGTGAVGVPTGAGAAGGTEAASPGGAHTGGTRAAGAGGAARVGAVGAGAVATRGADGAGAAGGTGAGGAAGVVAGDPGAKGTGAVSAVSGGAARPRLYYVLLLQRVLGLPPSTGPTPHLLSLPPFQSQSQLQPASPPPSPSPYSGPTRGLTERREPESRLASPESRPESPIHAVRIGLCVQRQRPPPVPGTHYMTLRPSTAPQRVPLPSPPASSLSDGPDPESDSLRDTSPTVTRFLATAVSDPSFESTAASALVAELVHFVAACRLDYATSLVAESESASVCPPSVGDAPDIPTPRSYAEAIEGPYASQWQKAMDTEMTSWKSIGTYFDEVPPPGANIVSGMWIFRVKRPPGSLPVFKARYVPRGFSQRKGVDFFQTFSPIPKMTTLRGSLHEEISLRRPPGFTGSFPAGTQWSLRRPVYGLRQAPREWHDTLRTALAALGFASSIADPQSCRRDTRAQTWVLRRFGFTYFSPQSTPLPTGHSLSAPPSDESVEPRGCLIHWKEHMDAAKRVLRYLWSTSGMGLMLGGRARVVLTGHADASWVDDLATQRSSQGYTFSLGYGSVSWRSTRSSSVLSSSCEAEIYAGAMAAQELRWLTYLLTDLGEAPRSPPVLYVDNKAMIALCQEHRLEHRTKHIALRYFLARELQQRGQLRLAYVATRANTADVCTKALPPCDHQRFRTVLGLVPTVPHLLTS
ncbi:unnamed protein product [Closterium sp. NIES-53]